MLIYTGMRIGELFGLYVTDCHENYVIGGEKTEAGKNRIIPIRPEGRAYFADFKARATGDLLLSGYSGQKIPANFRKRDFYALLNRLGIEKKTPHATRHTYASWARKSGIAPEALQKILGHASYTTTASIYVHADAEQLIAAVEAAGNCSFLLVTANVLDCLQLPASEKMREKQRKTKKNGVAKARLYLTCMGSQVRVLYRAPRKSLET